MSEADFAITHPLDESCENMSCFLNYTRPVYPARVLKLYMPGFGVKMK